MHRHTSKNAGTMHQKILWATTLIIAGAFALFGLCFIFFSQRSVARTSVGSAVNHFNQTYSFLYAQTRALRSSLDNITLNEDNVLLFNQGISANQQDSVTYDLISSLAALPTHSDWSMAKVISDSPMVETSQQAAWFGQDYVLPLRDFTATPWYKSVTDSNDACIWTTFDQLSGEDGAERYLILTRNLRYEYPGCEVYYIGMIKASFFDDLLYAHVQDAYCSSIIVNDEGHYLLGSIQLPEVTADMLVDAAWQPYDTSLQPVKAEGKVVGGQKVLLSTQRIRNTNLHLITCYAVGQACQDHARQSLLLMFSIMAPILLLMIVLATVFARTITQPLRRLTDAMLRVSDGDFDIGTLPQEKDADMRRLSHCFEYLVSQLKALMTAQYELGKQKKDYELRILQAQINPHFLYNTLDLIRWKAAKYQDREIQDLVISLSRYYRMSLSRGVDFVPLQTEIAHIREYVYIQNQRFDQGVALTVETEAGSESCMVPKLTLQPIVENSIYHGILEKMDPTGTILLHFRLEDGCLVISVRDNGCGMDEGTLQHLLDGGKREGKSGYGLYNVDQRIKLAYGTMYGLSFESRVGEGTCVTIRLPENREGEEKDHAEMSVR